MLFKISLSKPVRQKLAKGKGEMLVLVFDEVDLEGVGISEFRHYLTSNTAGGTLAVGEFICTARDGDSRKFGLSLADRLEECDPLGANGGGICGVFNVTAGISLSRCRKQSRAYLEARIWGIGAFSRLDSKRAELLW